MKTINIKAWTIKVWYEDDTSEEISDMPDDVANEVDSFLAFEQERKRGENE